MSLPPDNPRHECDEAQNEIRSYCTTCKPDRLISTSSVAYWEQMPPEMVEPDGSRLALEHYIDWIKHMLDVHGVIVVTKGT